MSMTADFQTHDEDGRMGSSQLSGLSVYASGTYPVELSVGKRVSARHRVPLRASVDISSGEVSFYVDPEEIEILQNDASDH